MIETIDNEEEVAVIDEYYHGSGCEDEEVTEMQILLEIYKQNLEILERLEALEDERFETDNNT